MATTSELYDRIGPDTLRAVVTDFYERLFRDVMIGFMFQGKDKQHLIEREIEMAGKFFGAPGVVYRGRPMRTAHAAHTIFGGQFERRLQVLRQAMAAHAVDPEVQRVWIEHTNALRAQVTSDKGSECKDTGEGRPKLAVIELADPDKPIKLGRR